MPIRSIDDLRKQVGPDWNDVSDEDLISSYAKSIEANPAAVAHQLGFGLEEGGKNSKRLSSSIDRYQAGLYGVGEEVTKAVGLDTASDWLGKQRRSNELRADTDSLRAQQLGAVDSWKDVHSVSDFGDYAVGLGIQSAPYLAEAALGGLAARTAMGGTRAAIEAATLAGDAAVAAKAKRALNIGSTAGATAASYPSSVGDILSNQREQAGQTDPLSAFALGVPYALANAVGVEGAAARGSLFRNTINLLDDAKGLTGGLARTAATGVTTGLKEGASETFQEGMNQLGRMAVDPTESFLSDAAQERFKESFIGGAVLGGGTASALGGWRRSQPTNDIQQVFQDTDTGTTPAPAVTQTAAPATVAPAPAPAPAAPVVVGGTSDIAQATQATQNDQAVADQALQQQAAREQVYEQFGIANPEDPTKGQFFGQKLFGPTVSQVADAMVAATQKMPPIQQELARAVTLANAETGNQLVKFAFNAADPAKSVAKALEAVGKVLTKFQIGHVQSAEEAGQILNTLSENAKGQQLEQINAMHVALTGEDTSGFLAVQNATTAKGAKDGKLQMQNPAGVGTVREQGSAGSPAQGNAGDVQPGGVQPVNAGSVPEGSLGLQTGQLPGEGVRPGTGGVPVSGDGSVVAQAPQVITEVQNGQQAAPAQAVGTSQAVEAAANEPNAPQSGDAGNRADVLQGGASAEQAEEDVTDSVGTLLRNVLKMVFRSEKKVEFLATFVRKQNDVTYEELGKRLGLSKNTIKQYQKLLRVDEATGLPEFIAENFDKFQQALKIQSELMGVDLAELRTALSDLAAQDDAAAAGVAEENDLINNGLAIQELKERTDSEGKGTGKIDRTNVSDLNEEGNKAEALNNRYLQLMDQLEQAENSGNEERADQLRDELAAVAVLAAEADKRARQQVKATAGNKGVQADKETDDAVQEPSAEKVDVRERARDGQAVGEGNAKGQAPAQGQTEAERAQEAWDKVASQYPNAPKFADLTDEQRETFIEFGEENWTPEDVQTELIKLAKAPQKIAYPTTFKGAPAYLEPAQRAVVDFMNGDLTKDELIQKFAEQGLTEGQMRSVTDRISPDQYGWTFGDVMAVLRAQGKPHKLDTVRKLTRGDSVTLGIEGKNYIAAATDEASLRRYPGVDAALRYYEKSGLRGVVDAVQLWLVAPDTVDFDAAVMMVNGKQALVTRAGVLTDTERAEWSIHHELGHVADDAFNELGVFSGRPEFNLRIAQGNVKGMGQIAQEVIGFYNANPEHAFSKTMRYPLDRSKNGKLSADEVRLEMFAQLWATYTMADGKDFLADNLPATYELLENIHEALQSEGAAAQSRTQAAQAGQGQAAVQDDRGAQGVAGAAKVRPEILRSPAGAVIPQQLREPVNAVTTNTWAGVKKAGLALAITEDVIKLAQKTMKSAADYLKAQYDQQATRLKFELQVEKILQQYDKLPAYVQGTGQNSANRLIHDMTFEGKWGFVPSYNQNVTLDNAMVQRFNAMPASAQQLIRDVFEHGHNALVAKQDAVKAAADKVFAARIADAQGDKKELAEIALERKSFDEKFTRILKIKDNKPYAYLGRYGNFVAVAKSNEFMEAEKLSANGDLDATKWLKENESNPDHYMVSFAETQAEADRMAADWKGSGKFGQTYASEKLDSSAYIGGGDLFLAFKRMENMITRKAKNELVGGTVLEGMRKLLADMYLASVAESSAHTSSLARKNISGADMDMMRNLATRGRADAHFLAALQHGDKVTDAMDRMIDERKDNPRESTPVLNELLKRQAQSMEYKLPGTLAQNLTQLSTVYYLSTSPAFYIQQLLQTAVLSLPFMAGRLGYFRSVRAIQQAYGDIRTLVKGLGVNEHVDFDKAPADVRAMLQTLVGMGKIDIGIDSDAKARSSDQGVMSKVMRKLQGVNTRIETINRATAAIAAYRGYMQKYPGASAAAATQYAADVVSNTHGSYDGFNTPRALSTDVGRVVGQFKRFQIIQLSMLGKLIHTAFKSASPEEKAVARASLRFITSHMAVLGGALGVPFVSQLGNILVNIFGDDDEPKDLEQKLRELIGDEAVADLVLRGVPASVGLESLGKKLAMENVASILPFTDVNLADRDALTKVYVSLLGPSAALSLKMADGLSMMRKGEYYKGLELALPTGVSNAMKAGRFATEGVTMRNGDSVLGPDGVSMVDAAFQAVGLPTNTITDRQRIQTVVAETDKFYEDRASQIKLDYTRAFKKGDSGAMQDAREEWMQLQDARSRNGYTRQPLSTLFRAPMEQAKRERNTAGGVEFNKNNRRFVESLSQ